MPDIIIRLAAFEDCWGLAVLKREVWNTTYRGIYPDAKLDGYDVAKHEQAFKDIIANPAIRLFAATDGAAIVGYMDCGVPLRPFREYQQEIGLLYVHKSYQGKGLGKRLFVMGREKIKSDGYKEFFISCNSFNKSALEFYIKMGGSVIHVDEDKPDKSEVQTKLHYDL